MVYNNSSKNDEGDNMRINLSSNNYATITYYDEQSRDAMLILPGGGYSYASSREAEPVAKEFRLLGLHTVIYQYRETLLVYPKIVEEASELLDIMVQDPKINHIHVIGFSAGGHFALMLLEKYSQYFASGILCYPVISVHQTLYHGESFKRLTGGIETDAIKNELSLEFHVHKEIPPIFIFHTVDDAAVPIGNSLVLVEALRNVGVSVEAHLFPHGKHGASVATKDTPFENDQIESFLTEHAYLYEWVNLARSFVKRHMS